MRKKPTMDIEVEVTQQDIDEAVQRGLTGAQMIERSVERALQRLSWRSLAGKKTQAKWTA
jgi:hypothetical protein